MMLYEHGNLVLQTGHRCFHPVHMSSYRFHVASQFFKGKLDVVQCLAVGNRFPVSYTHLTLPTICSV